ncbi:MAG: VWA domain-containing protein [Planctomycetes bacterium]|nr:VWA domain-containing protein [Planctomycetota bacterium]
MTAPALGWQWLAFEHVWLLPVVLLLALYRAWRRPRLPSAMAPWWLDPALATQEPAVRSWRQRLGWLPAIGETAAVLLAVVALMQPVQVLPLPPRPPGRDLLLCLDTSSSMAAEDLAPGRTRFAVGIELASAFVRARTADRIGFVPFARFADLRCPPTADHEAVVAMLSQLALVPHEGPEDATAVGAAVGTAAAALRRSPAAAKVIVLVTDGEENVATIGARDEIAPLHAAQLCRQAGIRVHTIVVGRGNQQPDGRTVPLDTTAVQQLSRATGGRFFTAGDERALAQVYAAIDALEATAFTVPGTVVQQWFPALLAAAVLLLALARWLATGWLRRLP